MTRRRTPRILFLPALLLLPLLVACGSSSETPDANNGSDSGGDAGLDTIKDAPLDSAPPLDSKPDVALPDAGPDTGPRSWQTVVVDDSPKFKQRAVVQVGTDGLPQLAYNVATEPEGWFIPSVWHAVSNAASGFDRFEAVPADSDSRLYPSMIVDEAQRTHIFYTSLVAGYRDIFHVWTDDRQSYSEPVNITNTTELKDYFPVLAVGPDNVLHLLYHREHKQNSSETSLAYRTITDDGALSELEVVATDVSLFALNPDYSMSVAGDGTVFAVFSRPGQGDETNVLWLRKRDPASGTWSDEKRLTSAEQEAWGPSIGLEASGTAHLVYVIGPPTPPAYPKTLTYLTIDGDDEASEPVALTSSVDDRCYHLGLLVEPHGRLHIAFSRLDENSNADIFYLSGNDGVFLPEQRITETPEGDELHPAIALGGGGEVYVAFSESLSKGPDGEVFMAIGRSE